VSQNESGESEAVDLEEDEDGAPNKNKASQKGKNKPSWQDIQAARCTDTRDTAGKLEIATSDGKCKATNT